MDESERRFRLGPIDNPVRGLLQGTAAGVAAFAFDAWAQSELPAPERALLLLFAGTHAVLFSVSALYHSVPWSPRWKTRMQRLDHAMIFVATAGTCTAVALLVSTSFFHRSLVGLAWSIALLGAARKIFFAPDPVDADIRLYLVQAFLGVPALLALAHRHPGIPLACVLTGALSLGLGAVAFATQRPILWPRWFSFHEVFHFLVMMGSAALLLAAGFLVAPAS